MVFAVSLINQMDGWLPASLPLVEYGRGWKRDEGFFGDVQVVVWSGVYSDSFERRAFRRS